MSTSEVLQEPLPLNDGVCVGRTVPVSRRGQNENCCRLLGGIVDKRLGMCHCSFIRFGRGMVPACAGHGRQAAQKTMGVQEPRDSSNH